MNEAAQRTGLSVSTLRRRRDDLRTHGATQHANGSWSIPIDTLVSLGMLDRIAPDEPAQDVAPDEVADLRVEVERERGLRLAAEREVQAITAHLATAQSTIRMIEAAPPKIETRLERIEVPVTVEKPVTPRWVWPVVVAAVLVALLAAVLTGWDLTRHTDDTAPAPQPTNSQHSTPAAETWPTPPTSLDPQSPVTVDVAPPTP